MSFPNISAAFPGWETDGVLGSGPFGTVYLAHTLVDGKPAYAAVKVIKTPPREEAIQSAEGMGISRDLLRTYFGKFKNELNWELTMFKSVNSHNLVNVDTVAMEDLPGAGWVGYIRSAVYTPMKIYFDKVKPTEEDAVRLGAELSSALAALSEYGMVHGEIKPENVMVSDSGAFLLGDYAVRRCLEKAGTELFSTGDSPFDGPEIGEERNYTAKTDIYALGMLIAYTARGMELPENTGDLTEGLDPKLSEIILKATAADPEQRYDRAEDMYNDLVRLSLYPKGKTPRRAIAAATAFDLVKKNGGDIKAPSAPASEEKQQVKPVESSKEKKAFSKKFIWWAVAVLCVCAIVIALAVSRCSANGDGGEDNTVAGENGDNTDPNGDIPTMDIDEVDENGQKIDSQEDGQNQNDEDQSQQPEDETQQQENQDNQGENTQNNTQDNTQSGDTQDSTQSENTQDSTPSGNTQDSQGEDQTTGSAEPELTNVFIFPDSDSRLISESELEGFDREKSYTAINEIYARHGKIFGDPEIQEYFEGQSWYEGTTNSSSAVAEQFNSTEQANIRTIVEYQEKMGYRDVSEPENTAQPEVTQSQYILPTDTRAITREDLEGFDREMSYMAINEIYARHGKIFSDSFMQEYFENQSWYKPVTEDSSEITPLFSELERENLHVLTAYQREMGYRDQ